MISPEPDTREMPEPGKYVVEFWDRWFHYHHESGLPVLTPGVFYAKIDELPSVAEAVWDGRSWWVNGRWTSSHDIIEWSRDD